MHACARFDQRLNMIIKQKSELSLSSLAVSMSLSKEKQVDIVISHKKNIVDLTNKILKIVHDASKTHKFTNEQQLQLKQLINETISEMTTVASFCGNAERNWVSNMTKAIGLFTIYTYWETSVVLEHWCLMANSITLDFNKTPFKFFSADLRLKWHDFETRIKGVADRRDSHSKSS